MMLHTKRVIDGVGTLSRHYLDPVAGRHHKTYHALLNYDLTLGYSLEPQLCL